MPRKTARSFQHCRKDKKDVVSGKKRKKGRRNSPCHSSFLFELTPHQLRRNQRWRLWGNPLPQHNPGPDRLLSSGMRPEIPVRRCRSCGRYFLITGRITAEYCSRLSASRKLCRSTAPVQKWAESRGRVQGMVKKSARIIPKRGRPRRDRPRVLFQRDQKHFL